MNGNSFPKQIPAGWLLQLREIIQNRWPQVDNFLSVFDKADTATRITYSNIA